MLGSLFDKVADLKACILIKKETPTQVFSCEYCQIFKNILFYRKLHVHCTLQKFYVMLELFGHFWVQNWYFSHFLCHCLDFLCNSVRFRSLWLFRTCFRLQYYTYFYISNRFISNQPSDGELLNNFQGSTLFHLATVKTTD